MSICRVLIAYEILESKYFKNGKSAQKIPKKHIIPIKDYIKGVFSMPFSAILFIVSILVVIGIISVTEAIIRVIIKGKNPPDTVLIKVTEDSKNLDLILREILRKYPFSKIEIDSRALDSDSEKLLELIKKDFPDVKINPPK